MKLEQAVQGMAIAVHPHRGGSTTVAFQTAQGMEVRRVLRTLGYSITKTTRGVLPFVWYFDVAR